MWFTIAEPEGPRKGPSALVPRLPAAICCTRKSKPESDAMTLPPPETRTVHSARIACDGGEGALGHPRVWLSIPAEAGFIDCPYCDARFVLAKGAGAHSH